MTELLLRACLAAGLAAWVLVNLVALKREKQW